MIVKEYVLEWYFCLELTMLIKKNVEKLSSQFCLNKTILFMVGDKKSIACKALGNLRVLVAQREGLTNKDEYKPIWVTEFPMFDYDEDNDRYVAMHHPFTAPRESDIDKLDRDLSLIHI